MRRLTLAVMSALALLGCDTTVDCPAKAGYNECGYCKEDRATSSNPHAGMCTYCTGACVSACDPCGGGSGGSCDTSWTSKCGTTSGGIQFVGQPIPASCSCPSPATYQSGVDNVTAGGPYKICTCSGF